MALYNSSAYVKDFCGEDYFLVWDESHHNFGQCFQKAVLCGLSYCLLAIFSAFYIGKETSSLVRTKTQRAIIIGRFIVSICLFLIAVLKPSLLSFYADVKLFWVDILVSSVQVITWLVHLAYIYSLKHHLSRGTRGPRPVIIAWVLTLLCSIFLARSAWIVSDAFPEGTFQIYLLRYLVTTELGFQVLYLVTLFPHGRTDTEPSSYSHIDEPSSYQSSAFPRFREAFDPYYLGTAEEGVNKLSLLTFHWVNLMMEKGNNHLLESVDDLYDLPYSLRCETISQKVQRQMLLNQPLLSRSLEDEDREKPKYLLLKALHQCFGVRFYAIGVLKFIGDTLAFASPLLLNVLVQFVEGKENVQLWQGYAAGFGICLTTLISAFLIVHFNYFMAKINIQLRAAIVSAVFRKVQHLSAASLSKFSAGEIVNLMSTDTDRVINFCLSFHNFWSLPVQLAITLFLLYSQIGIAFLAGVLFAAILIPINRILAVKIGVFSRRMLHFKDKRLSYMSDLLSRIKEVKLNSWENLFKRKIMDERYGEVKGLSGKKYLDAACVYFWACTPVIIPIITFGTFSALGNEMEPAKVFTAVALFNMLMTPLNAFPWVINGLVEAWVSMKRIERLMQMKEYNYDDFYTVVPSEGYHKADVQILFLKAHLSWNNGAAPANGRSTLLPRTTIVDGGLGDSPEVYADAGAGAGAEAEAGAGAESLSPRFRLEDINLELHKNQVIAIVGKVGSGKSALLYAVLGELEKKAGVVSVAGLHQGFGLAMQTPWLQNLSVKENILFGYNFDPSRYRSVIGACALEEDLRTLSKADDTKCGENGASLSGGQKARVTLARAVYQNKNIYLLDDVLCNVDLPVAKQIMERCIHGLLAGRTVLLVTHHHQLLSRVDWIIHMDNGKVKAQGTPAEVLPLLEGTGIASKGVSTPSPPPPPPQSASGAVPRTTSKQSMRGTVPESAKTSCSEKVSPLTVSTVTSVEEPMEVESRSFGELNCAVYSTYLASCGVLLSVLVFFTMLLMQASRNLVDVWLAKWVSHSDSSFNGTKDSTFTAGGVKSLHIPPTSWDYPIESVLAVLSPQGGNATLQSTDSTMLSTVFAALSDMGPVNESYFIVYIILALTNTVFALLRAFLFAYAGIAAAKSIHRKLLDAVVHSKISFFDLNPLGRILNRFSTDVYTIDDTLPFQANILFAQTFMLAGSLVITIYGLPWIVLLYIPVMFIYYTVQQYYRRTSRDLRRIYSLSLSPLYNHFTETIQGQLVIRALRANHRFGLQLDGLLEQNQRAQFCLTVSSQWLNIRLQLIGVGILVGVVVLALWEHHIAGINPGLVGLVISYALSMSSLLNGVVTYLTETERELISVERVHQYLVGTVREGQTEAMTSLYDFAPSLVPPPIALPRGWPHMGEIRFENVYLRYHDHNPYSLRNITFTINPCEKVGIVGRTGAGKTSLLMALFRLVELARGKIFIDGVDISEITIKKLRTSMAIVSQDVLFFSGSVRENLDPRGENGEREIVSVIDQCELSSLLDKIGDLDTPLKGHEMSVGEKQLFCLARALLSRTKIVCVDEGTGLLDPETESRVHRVMRDAFRNKTVFLIAHRMHVIKDCDRVIVLSDGEIAEMGRPTELMEDSNSVFSAISHSQKFQSF